MTIVKDKGKSTHLSKIDAFRLGHLNSPTVILIRVIEPNCLHKKDYPTNGFANVVRTTPQRLSRVVPMDDVTYAPLGLSLSAGSDGHDANVITLGNRIVDEWMLKRVVMKRDTNILCLCTQDKRLARTIFEMGTVRKNGNKHFALQRLKRRGRKIRK